MSNFRTVCSPCMWGDFRKFVSIFLTNALDSAFPTMFSRQCSALKGTHDATARSMPSGRAALLHSWFLDAMGEGCRSRRKRSRRHAGGGELMKPGRHVGGEAQRKRTLILFVNMAPQNPLSPRNGREWRQLDSQAARLVAIRWVVETSTCMVSSEGLVCSRGLSDWTMES